MPRGLDTDQRAAALAPHRVSVLLMAAFFDSGALKLAACPWTIPGGYVATGAVLSFDQISESIDSTDGMTFTLSGLAPEIVDIAANEPYIGRIVQILKARLDGDSHALIGAPTIEWIGRMQNMVMRPSNSKFDIVVTAEHYEIELNRAAPRRWNDADQQRAFPGDKGCEYTAAMTEKYLPWPNKDALASGKTT